MDVPLNVDVNCADGPCGRSTTIILNPVSLQVTHLVVREGKEEYMVPLDWIVESTPNHILLRCTYEELVKSERFVKMQFVGEEKIDVQNDLRRTATESDANYWPYASIDDNYVEVFGQFEQVPHDELAIHKGAHVEASDGFVGKVDEFIVDPTSYHVSHLVLRRGHLWGQRDVTIPISEIDRVEQDTVILNLNKESVKALPTLAVKRNFWR